MTPLTTQFSFNFAYTCTYSLISISIMSVYQAETNTNVFHLFFPPQNYLQFLNNVIIIIRTKGQSTSGIGNLTQFWLFCFDPRFDIMVRFMGVISLTVGKMVPVQCMKPLSQSIYKNTSVFDEK